MAVGFAYAQKKRGLIMTKLLSASLLALGVMVAAPVVAGPAENMGLGVSMYIEDPNKPIEIRFGAWGNDAGGNTKWGYAYALHGSYVEIATLDANGNFVDNWEVLFYTNPTNPPNQAAVVELSWRNPDYRTWSHSQWWHQHDFSYQAGEGAVEVVFRWSILTYPNTVYDSISESGLLSMYRVEFNVAGSEWSTFGANDGAGYRSSWDNILITMNNITGSPSVIPEPETYAMMLAGLGLMGVMVRRRRRKGL
jgi:hypothetical protein